VLGGPDCRGVGRGSTGQGSGIPPIKSGQEESCSSGSCFCRCHCIPRQSWVLHFPSCVGVEAALRQTEWEREVRVGTGTGTWEGSRIACVAASRPRIQVPPAAAVQYQSRVHGCHLLPDAASRNRDSTTRRSATPDALGLRGQGAPRAGPDHLQWHSSTGVYAPSSFLRVPEITSNRPALHQRTTHTFPPSPSKLSYPPQTPAPTDPPESSSSAPCVSPQSDSPP